jgi:C4-dicarboxylate transporter DctM subunit
MLMASMLVILLFVFIAIGLPIVFCIEMAGALFLMITQMRPLFLVVQRTMVGMDHFTLLSITLFILAGFIMEESSLSKRLVSCVDVWCGRLPGSVGVVTIISCTIFAALTGSGPATVAAIGGIMAPSLIRAGYKPRDAAGLVAAGGALGPIIPPSVPMISYGSTMSLSIPKMFMASAIPGLFIALLYILVNVFQTKKWKLAPMGDKKTLSEKLSHTWKALPVLLLPVIILGGIYGGIFTPTEAATSAVVYSLGLALFYRELTPSKAYRIFARALQSSGCIITILGAANLFAWLLTATRIPVIVSRIVISVVHNQTVYMLILLVILFIMGTLMETIATIVLLAPILVPIGIELGMDPLHLGVTFCIALIVGFITPPFGINLFAAVSATGVTYTNVVKGVIPYMVAACVAVIIIAFCPFMTQWLPNLLYGK